MKKLINDMENMLTESLDGFVAAHGSVVRLGPDRKFVMRTMLKPGKVGLISGGGSGHEPLHVGFVGHGMLDAACPGQVFTSPTPDQIAAAAAAVETGAGCLFIVKNYDGDLMNFGMAREMRGRNVETVIVDDDVAIAKAAFTTGRRGVAGTLVVQKIVGAGAESGLDLKALKLLGEEVNRVTRSMGVALTSCTVPEAGTPTFSLAEDEIEMGVGIHGEPGRRRVKMMSANAIAEELSGAICADLNAAGEALVLVNGFGATPMMELHLMVNAVRKQLVRHGIAVGRALVGNYVTSLDMAGCSLTVTLLNDKLTALWDAPVLTPALRWRM